MASGGRSDTTQYKEIVPCDNGVKVERRSLYFVEKGKQYEHRWFCGLIYFYRLAPAKLWNYLQKNRNKIQTPEPRTQVISHAFATSILTGMISYSLTT